MSTYEIMKISLHVLVQKRIFKISSFGNLKSVFNQEEYIHSIHSSNCLAYHIQVRGVNLLRNETEAFMNCHCKQMTFHKNM